jgi:hypothetical protein
MSCHPKRCSIGSDAGRRQKRRRVHSLVPITSLLLETFGKPQWKWAKGREKVTWRQKDYKSTTSPPPSHLPLLLFACIRMHLFCRFVFLIRREDLLRINHNIMRAHCPHARPCRSLRSAAAYLGLTLRSACSPPSSSRTTSPPTTPEGPEPPCGVPWAAPPPGCACMRASCRLCRRGRGMSNACAARGRMHMHMLTRAKCNCKLKCMRMTKSRARKRV